MARDLGRRTAGGELAQGRLDLHSKRGEADLPALGALLPDAALAARVAAANTVAEAFPIAEAGGHALAAEEAHFEELVGEAVKSRQAIAATAAALARIDVSAGQAERAAEGRWALPRIVAEPVLAIEGGRHPVVEAALGKAGKRFVANACTLVMYQTSRSPGSIRSITFLR